ncbi:ATP-dependent sacrificial sulfur transferase LarE [Terriglobus aquaticus]|uniref:ATP-dependent sacrificial sulfur transferase LarE n=1 Tax=Terriglobus aquaticus TaxID=940139 RepID=UPI0031D0DE43
MNAETMTLAEKARLLDESLLALGSVLIAYSGGTDSAFLAFAAHRVLGTGAVAAIADSASLPRAELAQALTFTAEHGIATRVLVTDEVSRPEYARNDSSRCFHCKDTLFQAMETERARLGLAHLAFGMNLDDRGEFRPGQRAAAQHRVVAPLVEAHLTKADIRTLAQEAGLTLWSKPASACLASRIEYGRPVTPHNLRQVEEAEAALHALGFSQVRVRHHGDLARIEIDRADLPRALSAEMLQRFSAALKLLGFTYVTVDADGYRSGSMNAVLPASAIAAAR